MLIITSQQQSCSYYTPDAIHLLRVPKVGSTQAPFPSLPSMNIGLSPAPDTFPMPPDHIRGRLKPHSLLISLEHIYSTSRVCSFALPLINLVLWSHPEILSCTACKNLGTANLQHCHQMLSEKRIPWSNWEVFTV